MEKGPRTPIRLSGLPDPAPAAAKPPVGLLGRALEWMSDTGQWRVNVYIQPLALASCYSVRLMTMTPEQRSIRARMAALARWSREDPKEHVAMMNRRFMAGFEKQVDPEGLLSETERRRRAEAARKLFYQHLAYKSSRARSKS